MKDLKELIEKKSKLKLKDFPQDDFNKLKQQLEENGKIEVWLMRGMGRWYLVDRLSKSEFHLPIQRKLCELQIEEINL